jgi:hypothetical protein
MMPEAKSMTFPSGSVGDERPSPSAPIGAGRAAYRDPKAGKVLDNVFFVGFDPQAGDQRSFPSEFGPALPLFRAAHRPNPIIEVPA